MRGITSLFITAVLLAVAAPASAQGTAAAGEKLFADNKCTVCHSVKGVGNKKFPLDGAGKHHTPESVRLWLVDSKAAAEKAGKKLAMPMKSFKTLPPADLDALVAYVLSLR